MCICRVLGSSIAHHSWLGSDTYKRGTEAIWVLSFVRSETQKSLGYILNMKCFRSEHTTNNWDPFGLWHQRHKPIYEHIWAWCIWGSEALQSSKHVKITVLLRSTKKTEIIMKWRFGDQRHHIDTIWTISLFWNQKHTKSITEPFWTLTSMSIFAQKNKNENKWACNVSAQN